ncbi:MULTISPECIES: ammonium transporter [unclassified Brevibacterium]|uniref:ammonium transporter n=1 Tax=unclassified Brevibacterium TaxID=2614124 RepID=UPI001E43ADBC|nr:MULTISPECIES: ammonium transporter [unclassified Brevibacterium]MCD1285899.1 ammonia channel protein [Brevibacterium sp. CCUG 69071]MDK8434963.1 ammonium transporter [Brevibacterium sp. H-BE7]
MELDAVNVWMMVAAGLVLLMTPGVAFFYGGMTRITSSINMMMMVFSAMAVGGLVWVLYGYGLSSGESIGGIVGNPLEQLGLTGAVANEPDSLISIGYGSTFAMIAIALIAGAVADRAKFSTWLVFSALWVTLVYCPLAFMVWGDGILTADGAIGSLFGPAIDFAGGTVVHINAGVSALVLVVVMGRRARFSAPHKPHNIPITVLGAALLWFGWFGFNGGAASTIEQGGLIWINTLVAPAAGMITWIMIERIRSSRPSSIGSVSGLIAGLVAITPACASVDPYAAILIGIAAGAGALFAVEAKNRLRYDDALDVVAVHLVAGVIGTVMIGFFAFPNEESPAGLFYGGGFELLIAQILACLVALVFAGLVTLVIALALRKTMGLRIDHRDELDGIDNIEHAEQAYSFN